MPKVPVVTDSDLDLKRILNSVLQRKDKGVRNINYENIALISKQLTKLSELNNNIIDLFPDINIAIDIVVSSIISPNSMTNENILIKFNNIPLNLELSNSVLNIIQKYVKENINLDEKIDTIIEEAMFKKGAYIEAYIPVEQLINGYTKRKKAKEKLRPGFLSVEDDFTLLIDRDITAELNFFSTGLNIAGMEDVDITENMLLFSGDNNSSIYIKKLKYENVIPIADKENPGKHYGYFVLLNTNNQVTDNQYVPEPYKNFMDNQSTDVVDKIIRRAKQTILSKSSKIPPLKNIDDIRDYIINTELTKLLSKKNIRDLVDNNKEILKIVADSIIDKLAKDENVIIMFLPASMVQYFAYTYKDSGVGESLLEKALVLLSMKAVIMFAKLIAYIKSNISITEVDVDLDEDDPDPQKTMETIIGYVVKNRQLDLPIGVTKVDDLVDWAHKVGFKFNFNHPGIPNVKIDIEEKTLDIKPIDDELKEEIDKSIYRIFGLNPDMIDEAYGPDFATTIVKNSILFAKRIAKYQRVFNKHFTESIQKILLLDNTLREMIKTELRSNARKLRTSLKKHLPKVKYELIDKYTDEELIDQVYLLIVKRLQAYFPAPVVTENTNLADMFDEYKNKLDDAVEIILNSDVLPDEIVGQLDDNIDNIKNLVKAILIKRWIIEHNYLEGLPELFKLDKDGKPMLNVLDEYKEYVKALEKAIIPFLKETHKLKKKIDEEVDKIENDDESEGEDEEEMNENTTKNENEENEKNEENEENNEQEENEEPEVPNV